VPLNTGPLGDHADRRERRSDASMQIDGGLDDALPGRRLVLGAALEGVGPCHVNLVALSCAIIIDKPSNFDTHHCTSILNKHQEAPGDDHGIQDQ
jgi:hypothetical protein